MWWWSKELCSTLIHGGHATSRGARIYNWNKLVPVVLKILAETDASLERFCCCWR
jgi:hypothetical protein